LFESLTWHTGTVITERRWGILDSFAVSDDAGFTGLGTFRGFISTSFAFILRALKSQAQCTVHATGGDQVWLDHGCEWEIMFFSGTNLHLIRRLVLYSGVVRCPMDLPEEVTGMAFLIRYPIPR